MTSYYTNMLSTHNEKCEKLIEEYFQVMNDRNKIINDSYYLQVYTINEKKFKNESLKELILQELEIKNKKQLLKEKIVFDTKVEKLNKKHQKLTAFCNRRIEQLKARENKKLGIE